MQRLAPLRRPRIRWRIFWLLCAFAAMLYFQQRNVTVAAERIMPELSLSQMQIGWLQWAFVLSYALMQFPGGVFGQRIGARRALTILSLIAVAATVVLPLAPNFASGTALFAVLLSAQFALGAVHAPFFPIIAGVIESWLPANRWAFANGVNVMASQVGAALAPPLLVILMHLLGWQRALFWAALPPLILVAIWAWYGRNTPREHPGVSAVELGELDATHIPPADSSISARRVLRILVNRDIAMLTLSYVCMNYAYYLVANWSFLYLIQERHFSALEGGWLASLPPLGAALGAGIGGGLTDALCKRFGIRWGYRLVPLMSLPVAGVLLLFAVYSSNPYAAVAALTLSFMAIEVTEGSYWGGTSYIAKADTMAATGVLNTGGNLGGIIGVPIVAYLSGHHAWNAAFIIGFIMAVLAAAIWFAIDLSRPVSNSKEHA
jgi:MFS transporter, ACS family, glucarate transporter